MKVYNKVFVVLFSITWLTLLVLRLLVDKGQFLITLGSQHSNFWNHFFSFVTQFAEELAYLTLAVIFLFIRYRIALAIAFTGIAVTLLAAFLKWFFSFERPYLYFKNLGLEARYSTIEGIEPYVGLTSFPSGHAMAGFALMSLVSIYVRNRYLAVFLFLLAFLVGLSRIYLGHHFLEDVLFGSLLGVLVSYFVYVLMEKWKVPVLDQSFVSGKKINLNPR